MPKLNLTKCNIHILGSWNQAIIQPNWLKKEFPEIIPENGKILAEMAIGAGSQIRLTLANIKIQFDSTQLIVINNSDKDDSLKNVVSFSKKICTILNHTPIIAIGFNFYYELDDDEIFFFENDFKRPEILKLYSDKKIGPILAENYEHKVSLDDNILNIKYGVAETGKKEINFNYHKDIINSSIVTNFMDNYDNLYENSTKIVVEITKQGKK